MNILLSEKIRENLENGFEEQLYQAALDNLSDLNNPLRYNNFIYAMRELLRHILSRTSPENNITKCMWYKSDPSAKTKVSRRQRLIYAVHGGLSEQFIKDELFIDTQPMICSLLKRHDYLCKYTHINPETFNTPNETVSNLVNNFLKELYSLFTEIENCKKSIIINLSERLDQEVINNIVSDLIQEIDLLATHYYIENVFIENKTILSIDYEFIHIEVEGEIEVELAYGSSSDERRGEAHNIFCSFPFTCYIPACVDDIHVLVQEEACLDVDTSEWYEE